MLHLKSNMKKAEQTFYLNKGKGVATGKHLNLLAGHA